MKKKTILLIAVLVLFAAATAAVCYGLYRADAKQSETYADYAAALASVDGTTFTVEENGAPVAAYTLADLGVRSKTLSNLTAPYSALDRMEPDAFRRCSIQTRLSYLKSDRPTPVPFAIDTTDFDATEILSDLHAKRRTPSTDAHVEFSDAAYHIVPETQGTEIDDAAVTAAALTRLQTSGTDTPDSGCGAALNLEISESLYIPPAITVNNISFDPSARLASDLSGKTLEVGLGAETRGLSESAISQLLSVSEDGKVSVNQDDLAPIIQKWAEDTDKYGVDYVFSAYSGQKVPISFLKVNYNLDQPALLKTVAAQLQNLDFSPVKATEICTRNGETFDISGTYVEVDIDRQTMTMYKDGKCLVHTSIVTGALDGHQTPTGFYHVENKETDAWLSGPDYLVFVKYWVGIYGPYGLHDSSWRENYGSDYYVNGGSHGCVNTPESAMKTIFDNINVGDPVLVFGKNQWYDTSKT